MAKRRKQGSGTVRKRSDGRWEARVVVDYDEKGLPKTKTAVAKTRRECMDKLKALQEEYGPPVTKCKPDMSVGQWMDFWYQNYEKMKLRLTTQRGYEDRIYKHIIPAIGKNKLNIGTFGDDSFSGWTGISRFSYRVFLNIVYIMRSSPTER